MNPLSDNRRPFFSIITPSYNQGRFLRRTIESVLSQGEPGLEHLIFDGGSTDETVNVLRSFGEDIRWVSEPDRGQAHAVNKGLVAARGEVIGWLNSDDVYYQGALRAVKAFFESRPEAEIVYGMADHIDESDGVIEPYYSEPWNYERLKDVCFICQPAVFFRRSVISEHGLLNENLRYCMDYEYWLRIGKTRAFSYLGQKLAGSRLHQTNKTLGEAVAVHEEILCMLKEVLRRVPSRWIFNHAHIVARHAGLDQTTPHHNLLFVRRIIAVVLADSLRLRHYIPLDDLRTIIAMYRAARRAARQAEPT